MRIKRRNVFSQNWNVRKKD